MNRDDVEAWKVNLQGVLDETNSNLKKFRELDRVDTHPNIDYDENGLDETNFRGSKKEKAILFDTDLLTGVNDFIIGQNKERTLQTKMLCDIKKEMNELKKRNSEEEQIKEILTILLSKNKLDKQEFCRNCIDQMKNYEIKIEKEKNQNVFGTLEKNISPNRPFFGAVNEMNGEIGINNKSDLKFDQLKEKCSLLEKSICEFNERLNKMENFYEKFSSQHNFSDTKSQLAVQVSEAKDAPNVHLSSKKLISNDEINTKTSHASKPQKYERNIDTTVNIENLKEPNHNGHNASPINQLEFFQLPDVPKIMRELKVSVDGTSESVTQHAAHGGRSYGRLETLSNDHSQKSCIVDHNHLQRNSMSVNLLKNDKAKKLREAFVKSKKNAQSIAAEPFKSPPLIQELVTLVNLKL